ncbi:MAG: GNAT family N-acetyltransferase [Planctomycetota bacterium]
MIPELRTERLTLRPLDEDHLEPLHEMYSDPEVTKFLDWEAPSLEEYRELYRTARERHAKYPEGLGVWAGFVDGRLAGLFMLKPLEETDEIEVGYHLARWAWGNGYATEGAAELMRHGFDTVGLDRIVAVVRPDNVRSLRVVERLGLEPDGEIDVYGAHCLLFQAIG